MGGYDGFERLNDLHRLYVGPLSPPPLLQLCAAFVRSNAEAVCALHAFDGVPPLLTGGLVWTRDRGGVLRARRLLFKASPPAPPIQQC